MVSILEGPRAKILLGRDQLAKKTLIFFALFIFFLVIWGGGLGPLPVPP